MKNRRMLPGAHPPIAEALGDSTLAVTALASGSTDSPVLVAAAGFAVREARSNSRRVAASVAHANGPAAGESPSPPAPNHASKPAPRP
jgi:hypothetical protein